MGQAFRRAAGRIKPASSIDSSASSLKMESVVDRKPPPRAAEKARESGALDSGDVLGSNSENVLEERDPQFDAMLSQMAGRIRSKPGGKLEMGEASVVERYDRPMPRLRNTDLKSSKYEDRPAPPGTLNVAQMRHIMLLHEGKAEDHDGPMGRTVFKTKRRVLNNRNRAKKTKRHFLLELFKIKVFIILF
ncbi:hypothetical protein SDJN03_25696, partial [Cucurbita argyrosperma subsp. sororia]